jgi:hypothetical protein
MQRQHWQKCRPHLYFTTGILPPFYFVASLNALFTVSQSRFHDGKDTLWHHARCFFHRKPNVKVDEIWHFHDLRWTDQLRLRKLAEGKSAEKIEDEDEVDEYVDVKG